jgi:hypothetical protein
MKIQTTLEEVRSIEKGIKKHHITSDPNGKRRIGNKVDFHVDDLGNHKEEITSKQLIEIAVRKNKDNYEVVYLQIDKKDRSNKLDTIAVNEGFEKVQSFLEWVYNLADEKPKDTLSVLRGKILHWTSIKY